MWDASSPGALPAAMDENESSQTQSVDLLGKGVAIRSSGECPELFSETVFIGICMCRGIQYACKAHQSMSEGHSYREQILSIDNNWGNTDLPRVRVC